MIHPFSVLDIDSDAQIKRKRLIPFYFAIPNSNPRAVAHYYSAVYIRSPIIEPSVVLYSLGLGIRDPRVPAGRCFLLLPVH